MRFIDDEAVVELSNLWESFFQAFFRESLVDVANVEAHILVEKVVLGSSYELSCLRGASLDGERSDSEPECAINLIYVDNEN